MLSGDHFNHHDRAWLLCADYYLDECADDHDRAKSQGPKSKEPPKFFPPGFFNMRVSFFQH